MPNTHYLRFLHPIPLSSQELHLLPPSSDSHFLRHFSLPYLNPLFPSFFVLLPFLLSPSLASLFLPISSSFTTLPDLIFLHLSFLQNIKVTFVYKEVNRVTYSYTMVLATVRVSP